MGTIIDYSTQRKLEVGSIAVSTNGGPIQNIPASGGRFQFDLNTSAQYDITFQSTGYYGKLIRIDSRNIPAEDQTIDFSLELDVSLLEKNDCFDAKIFQQPYGKAAFDPSEHDLAFDFAVTDKMRKLVENEIERCESLVEKNAALKKEFEKLLAEGDALCAKDDFESGIKKYESALKIFPTDAGGLKKLDDAKIKFEAWKKAQAQNAEYAALLNEGDKALSVKDYNTAKSKYTAAKTMRPNEKTPVEKLKQLDDMLAAAGKQKQYDELIAKADAFFSANDFEGCIEIYEQAQQLLPTQNYPKEQIAKARQAMADEANKAKAASDLEAKFIEAMKKGNDAGNAKNYDQAIEAFKGALKIKSNDTTAKAKISEMEKLLADAKNAAENAKKNAELEAKFQDAMKKADELATKKKYSEAIAQYKAANTIKPEDTLPKTKVAEMEKLLDQEALAKKNEETEIAYQAALKEGNTLADKKQYQDAIAQFQLAQSIKQTEQLPKDKIAEMQNKLSGAEQERLAAEQQAKYKALMNEAIALSNKNELDAAIGKYKEALSVIPSEQQPKDEIEALQKRIAEELKNREASGKEAAYNTVMTTANELATKKQYQLALEKYTQASFMKTEEKLPKDKMAEMHRLMQAEIDAAASAELEAKFQKAMADAQKLADGNALAEAIAGFQSALDIKPNESLPVQRIAELQKRIDESSRPKTEAEVAEPLAQSAPDTTGSYLKRLDAEYQMHIQNGDNYFTAKNYSQAKTEYLAATALKHLERYPQSRIKLIDELTKPAAEKQQVSAVAEAKPKSAPINNEYDRRIAEANELFDAANWKAAKQAYAAALTTNPYSTFAKSRANQCDYAMRQDEHNAKMKNAAQAAADMRAARDQKRNEHAAAMQEAYARAEQDRAKRAEELNAMRASATTKKQQQNYQAKDPINRTSVGANAAREEQVEKEYRERREQEEKNKMNRINNQKAKYAGYSRNMERKADTRTKENLHHINDRKGEH